MYFFEKFSNFSPTRRADFVQRPPAKNTNRTADGYSGQRSPDFAARKKNSSVLPPQKTSPAQSLPLHQKKQARAFFTPSPKTMQPKNPYIKKLTRQKPNPCMKNPYKKTHAKKTKPKSSKKKARAVRKRLRFRLHGYLIFFEKPPSAKLLLRFLSGCSRYVRNRSRQLDRIAAVRFKALALRFAKPFGILLRALDILLPAADIEKGVELIIVNLQKACAAHGYPGAAVTAGEPHHTEIDRENHGGMVFHYTYFAVKSAAGERRIFAGFKLLFGREDVNGKGFFAVRSCRLPSDQSVFAFSSASSYVPTMKNAFSGTSSASPSTILRKPSTVSSTLTKRPS